MNSEEIKRHHTAHTISTIKKMKTTNIQAERQPESTFKLYLK